MSLGYESWLQRMGMAQTHQIGVGALKVDRSDSILLLLLIFSFHIHCFDNNIVIVS